MDNFTPSGPKYSAAVEEPVGERRPFLVDHGHALSPTRC